MAREKRECSRRVIQNNGVLATTVENSVPVMAKFVQPRAGCQKGKIRTIFERNAKNSCFCLFIARIIMHSLRFFIDNFAAG